MASARAVQHCDLGQRVLVARRRAGRGHRARDRAETASQYEQRRHAVAVDGTTSSTSADGRRARGRARPSGHAIRRCRDHTRRRVTRRRQLRYRRSSDDGDQAQRAALDAEQRRAKLTKGPIAGPLDRVDGRPATWSSILRASVPIRRGADGPELRCRRERRCGASTALTWSVRVRRQRRTLVHGGRQLHVRVRRISKRLNAQLLHLGRGCGRRRIWRDIELSLARCP